MFVILSSVYAPDIPVMSVGYRFIGSLLKTFLTGFAITAGVSLLIFPKTSRKNAALQSAGFVKLAKGCLSVLNRPLKHQVGSNECDSTHLSPGAEKIEKHNIKASKAPPDIRQLLRRMNDLYAKISIEVSESYKELSISRLSSKETGVLKEYFAKILITMAGSRMVGDHNGEVDSQHDMKVSSNISSLEHEKQPQTQPDGMIERQRGVLIQALLGGLDHIALTCGLEKPSRSHAMDLEKDAQRNPKPGETGYDKFLQTTLSGFREHRSFLIRRPGDAPRYLHLVRTHFMLELLGQTILDAVKWASCEIKAHRRLVAPSWLHLFHPAADTLETHRTNTHLSLKADPDPEHAVPLNRLQQYTNVLRVIPAFLSSTESTRAFRAAVATLIVAILAFLEKTRIFFLDNRLQWGLVMISICMTTDAGQNVNNFILQILGTVVAMTMSIVIWYVGGQNTVAILVLLYIYIVIGMYFLIKYPRYLRASIISLVSVILILGYQLQTRKLGVARATANGQPYYPVYILAPYRVAIVSGGIGVAFFFTYFPYPITTHRLLREDVGNALLLLSKFNACVASSVSAHTLSRVPRPQSALESLATKANTVSKTSSLAHVDVRRRHLFIQIQPLFPALRERSLYTKYEAPIIGGRFPKAAYDDLITSTSRIFNCLSLLGYVTDANRVPTVPIPLKTDASRTNSSRLSHKHLQSHLLDMSAAVTTISTDLVGCLWILGTCLKDKQPLQPYASARYIPDPDRIRSTIEKAGLQSVLSKDELIEKDVDTSSNRNDRATNNSAAYAVLVIMEVCSITAAQEVSTCFQLVKSLVGEVNFSITDERHMHRA